VTVKTSGEALTRKTISTLWITFTRLDSDLHKTALLQTLSHLSKNGNQCSLIAVQSSQKYRNPDTTVRVIPVPLRYKPFLSTVMFTALLTWLLPVVALTSKADFLIFDPDIHILSAFPALVILKPKKTKFILDIRTLPVETHGLRGFLKKFWFSISIITAKHFFNGLTIITPSMKNKICMDFNLPSQKVGVWTSGVSEQLFDPEKNRNTKAKFKETLGIKGRFIVFYHGVFSATRGLIETVEAMKILQTKYPDVILYLLGTGPIAEALKGSIEREGLQNNVFIADPVDQKQVPQYISIADVGIVPLPNHPFWEFQSPLKLMEYLAMEKAVILTNIEAHIAVIGHNKCGIYISSIRPAEIASAIEYAYLNRQYLDQWGKGGRQIVLEKYTWGKVVSELQNYLFSVK
jgi:glycosyltransferase involved in cell wall biosynthesis